MANYRGSMNTKETINSDKSKTAIIIIQLFIHLSTCSTKGQDLLPLYILKTQQHMAHNV
jgi:hypothetical protein